MVMEILIDPTPWPSLKSSFYLRPTTMPLPTRLIAS
jgi:hypothetical protein